jgi:hypothetical protein
MTRRLAATEGSEPLFRRKMIAICNSSPRAGAVLIIAMICLLLASVIAVSLVKLALAEREQIERDHWQLQAGWLAEAGLERAALQRHADRAYTGEVWTPPLAGRADRTSRVEILVNPPAAPTAVDGINVTVIADYPHDPHQRARVRKTATIPVNQPVNNP